MAEVRINVKAEARSARADINRFARESNSAFKRVATGGRAAFSRLNTTVKGTIAKLTSLRGLLVSYGALRVFGSIISESRHFETALHDLTKVTSESLDSIKAKILAMDSSLGNSTDLVKGYYQVLSSGVTEPARVME
ncbi:MAG: hypothetical protein ACE5GY_09800, partial [Thermodesulfobacteriota bacterium]